MGTGSLGHRVLVGRVGGLGVDSAVWVLALSPISPEPGEATWFSVCQVVMPFSQGPY